MLIKRLNQQLSTITDEIDQQSFLDALETTIVGWGLTVKVLNAARKNRDKRVSELVKLVAIAHTMCS